MTTLAWPTLTINANRVDWQLVGLTQVAESALSGAIKTQELPGAYWSLRVDYTTARGADANALWAFLAQMRGRAGRVAGYHLGRPVPKGVGGGSPLVNGAGQSGATLNVDGGPLSTAGWLLAGDMIGVGGYLYMLTADATTDGSGVAALSISPPLRASPVDNAVITLDRPTTTMMLVADEQGTSYAPGIGMQPFILTLREVLS